MSDRDAIRWRRRSRTTRGPESGASPTDSSDRDILALARRTAEAEDALRAIGAGEVDAFVISDGANDTRVFTLSTADRPYRRFVETMRDGAATVSTSGVILYANDRLADLLGADRAAIIGSRLADHVADDGPLVAQLLDDPAAARYGIECNLVQHGGENVPVIVGSAALDIDGEDVACLTFTDLGAQKARDNEIRRLSADRAEKVLELQAAQTALTRQASHDPLTGLPNRTLLVDRIDRALLHADRTDRCVAVIFIDLDGFKQVNDFGGHAAGDLVLREVAGRLVDALRPMDTVARIGGDEFVVLASEVDSPEHAIEISRRLVDELRLPTRSNLGGRKISASVGLTLSEQGKSTAELMLSQADTAMYHAKSLGGGRAEIFDAALGRRTQQRIAAQITLQAALDERRVIAHYQPIIDLDGGAVAGFEALARIREVDGSLLHPVDFIEIAEASGLVVPLGAQMLDMACAERPRITTNGAGGSAPSVAVNLSARQFETGDLTARVRSALECSAMDPTRLHLEITETAILDLQPEVLGQLKALCDLGVQIGLDDFGTGFASLTHLRRLPLQFVKIDRSFVSGLGVDPEDDRIVSAVVDLAAKLGLRSIAEGVETVEQMDRLTEFGCEQGQGYFFGRPTAPGEALATSLRSLR